MNNSRRRRLMGLAEPLMRQGEQIEVVALAKMGKLPVKRNVGAVGATMASAAVVGALGGGVVVGVAFVQKEAYLVLTDQQLLVFAGDPSTGRPGKHLASIPRPAITASVLKDGLLFLKVRLDVAGQKQPVRLTFPPIPSSARVSGRQFAATLQRKDVYAA
jgi:hypothetical protein